MNEKQKERFHEFIASWLRDHVNDYQYMQREHGDIERVIDVKEKQSFGGFCNTCYFESVDVVITYVTSTGEVKEYSYSGSMADLLGFNS